MAKFKESELTENLKEFENKSNLEIYFEKSIEGKIKLEEATIKFDDIKGYIFIESQNENFQINTTLVFSYEKLEKEIDIDLDTILLKIKKVD